MVYFEVFDHMAGRTVNGREVSFPSGARPAVREEEQDVIDFIMAGVIDGRARIIPPEELSDHD